VTLPPVRFTARRHPNPLCAPAIVVDVNGADTQEYISQEVGGVHGALDCLLRARAHPMMEQATTGGDRKGLVSSRVRGRKYRTWAADRSGFLLAGAFSTTAPPPSHSAPPFIATGQRQKPRRHVRVPPSDRTPTVRVPHQGRWDAWTNWNTRAPSSPSGTIRSTTEARNEALASGRSPPSATNTEQVQLRLRILLGFSDVKSAGRAFSALPPSTGSSFRSAVHRHTQRLQQRSVS
jgi:hypothetical protein